ncbi:MAG: hypothetical protein Q7U60_09690, partial [Candidatus Methanoperedens sp.]|nr:hypothetical protein [Candidatus Methanoperedens sp.]
MEKTCTKCGGTDFVKAGTKLSLEGKWRVYQCKRCSHKQRGELLTSFHSENEAENILRKTTKNKIEFEFVKGESFELDFVKDVLKNTNNPHRDKYLEVFNSKGLLTNKYEFWDIWEDFAEKILSKDFKLYKINRDIGNPYSEKIRELLSKISRKKDKIKDNILCDILKRKYQFEQFEERQPHVSGFTERKGIKYYYTPVINCNCVFFIPEVEKRREDPIVQRMKAPIVQRTKRPEREMAQLTMEFLRLQRFLTLTEKDEYIRKCEEIQYEEEEYDEARIQIVENI